MALLVRCLACSSLAGTERMLTKTVENIMLPYETKYCYFVGVTCVPLIVMNPQSTPLGISSS
uniref:AtPPa4 n=1 Tax=Arundo donax TaxID=35708 RepID=A0A0A9FB92_ARUDO